MTSNPNAKQFKCQLSISTYNINIILLHYNDGDYYLIDFQIATANS